MVFWGLKSSRVSNAFCKGTSADTKDRECLGKGTVKLELMVVKYQQAVSLGLGVEKAKYKGGEKEVQNPEKNKTNFHTYCCYYCHGHMNSEPISAVRRMGMVALACEINTWT